MRARRCVLYTFQLDEVTAVRVMRSDDVAGDADGACAEVQRGKSQAHNGEASGVCARPFCNEPSPRGGTLAPNAKPPPQPIMASHHFYETRMACVVYVARSNWHDAAVAPDRGSGSGRIDDGGVAQATGPASDRKRARAGLDATGGEGPRKVAMGSESESTSRTQGRGG
ncbi:hypothetical protein WOLCODRAFT_163507 [Wolfiporia cocos MD-104 SS10]|uniref:Uncharacterized protein n=1 Tax=Wolfiporia cocos (strain MD-104) TaxID=742152 RepID=A0A2H3JIS9_WOLCO|nr:hypothetical protein WOLCODRAFT_163507 [Wolfiporia cocos MD-104 SS10]